MAVSAQAATRCVNGRESRAEQRPARAKEKRHKGGEPEGAAHEERKGRGARTREREEANRVPKTQRCNKGRRKREKSHYIPKGRRVPG